MKLMFRGRLRHVITHRHQVNPRSLDGIKSYSPLKWESATKARGTVDHLGLSGDFWVDFEFEDIELRNWLEKYIEEQPEKGLALVQEMKIKATAELVMKNK